MAMAALVVQSPHVSAAGEGAISGVVTDERTGAPVGDACALAMEPGIVWGYDDLVEVARARTGADGRYRIPGLAADDDYRMVFLDCSERFHRYGTETWRELTGRRLDGTPVVVAPSTTTSGVDAALAQAGVL